MIGLLMPVFVGVVLIVIGIINMMGNISTLHSYHRHRVTEENVKPFGRMVGLGTILVGLGIVAEGGMMILAEKLQNNIFVLFGTILLMIFIVAGIALNVIAMKKYNGGIF